VTSRPDASGRPRGIPHCAQLNGRYNGSREENLALAIWCSEHRSGALDIPGLAGTSGAARRRSPRRRSQDGEHDARDQSQIEREPRTSVKFLGHRAVVERLLGAFDPIVLALHREGQPRVAMEAAVSHLSVVVTEIRSCGDVALGAVIARLLGAPEQRAAMSAAVAAEGRREFDERDVVACVMHACHWAAARRDIHLDPEPA
jgi:Glycosyl transferases group 1